MNVKKQNIKIGAVVIAAVVSLVFLGFAVDAASDFGVKYNYDPPEEPGSVQPFDFQDDWTDPKDDSSFPTDQGRGSGVNSGVFHS